MGSGATRACRMMSLAKIRGRTQLGYYERGDSGEHTPEVTWMGQGAEAMQVQPGQQLCSVVESLLANRGSEDLRAWDMTFSPPKSVSILWASATADARRAIEKAIWDAVQKSIRFLEDNCDLARSGHAGKHLEQAGLLVGSVMHTSNRNQEPFLHVHAVAANAAYRKRDGKFTSLFSRGLYQAKGACGAMFRSELAQRLMGLGIELRMGGYSFEVAGISDELIKRFSSRSAEIQRTVMGKPWQGSARAKELAALATRREKQAVTQRELEDRWTRDFASMGVRERVRLLELSEKSTPRVAPPPVLVAVQWAIRDLTQHLGHFTRFDMIRMTGRHLEAFGVTSDDVVKAVDQVLREGSLQPVSVVKGQQRWATQDVLAEEEKLLRRAERLRQRGGFQVPEPGLKDFLARSAAEPLCLNEEQRAALQRLAGDEALQLLRGVAGAGKTRLLKALGELWGMAGLMPLCLAPTHKAVLEMEAATGVPGQTVASLLWGRGGHLTNRSVVVVDEASMLGTKDALQLLKKVLAAGAKLVLVGDERQLQAVERGGAFLALWRRYGGPVLSASQRQKPDWYRNVVENVVDSRMLVALWQLERRGRLIEVEDDREGVLTMAATWLRNRTEDLRDSLAVAPTRAQVEELNQAIWMARVQAGELDPRKSIARDGRRFTVGDRVVFTSTDTDKTYFNGEFGTVYNVGLGFVGVRLDRDISFAGIRLPNIVQVRPFADSKTPRIELGYAVTAHKAQGATVERVFALAGSEQDGHTTYVQLSRGRADAWVVVSHHPQEWMADLAESVGRENYKTIPRDAKREMEKECVRPPLRGEMHSLDLE
jgi:conjugative relaxase-like TrwC/TraI family protein